MHWTASDYERVFAAYHVCVSGSSDAVVHHTFDLRANMRDVALAPAMPYAQHTAGRNSFAIGIAVCAMDGATPHDFGAYPITAAQIDAACTVAAQLARFYAIAPAAIRTHAEAALDDGYFGAGDDDLRWDIARFAPSPVPLEASEARACGDVFRERIAAML